MCLIKFVLKKSMKFHDSPFSSLHQSQFLKTVTLVTRDVWLVACFRNTLTVTLYLLIICQICVVLRVYNCSNYIYGVFFSNTIPSNSLVISKSTHPEKRSKGQYLLSLFHFPLATCTIKTNKKITPTNPNNICSQGENVPVTLRSWSPLR